MKKTMNVMNRVFIILMLCFSITLLADMIHAEENITDNSTDDSTNSTENLTINIVPNMPNVSLTELTNTLNCVATISDPDNNSLNATLEWYKNSTLEKITEYRDITALSDNVNKTEGIWYCRVRSYDGNYSEWGMSNIINITINTTIENITNTTINNTGNVTQNNTNNQTANETDDDSNETEENEHTTGEALNVRYDHLLCKVEFTNAQIDLFNKYLSTNLTSYKEKLIDDMNIVESLKNGSNKTAFDRFVTTTLKDDFHEATAQLRSLKKGFKNTNLTNASKTAIRNDFKELQREYSNCISDKDEKMAKIMLKHYENTRKSWEKIISKMEKKGISTENILNLTNELDALIQRLQDAIDSGNKSLIRDTMADVRNQELNAWAKFQIHRLGGYVKKMESTGNTEKLKDVKEKLEKINQYTKKGRNYEAGDIDKLWSDLKDASKELKDNSKEILREQKQQMKDERKLEKSNSDDRSDDSDSEDESKKDNENKGRGRSK